MRTGGRPLFDRIFTLPATQFLLARALAFLFPIRDSTTTTRRVGHHQQPNLAYLFAPLHSYSSRSTAKVTLPICSQELSLPVQGDESLRARLLTVPILDDRLSQTRTIIYRLLLAVHGRRKTLGAGFNCDTGVRQVVVAGSGVAGTRSGIRWRPFTRSQGCSSRVASCTSKAWAGGILRPIFAT